MIIINDNYKYDKEKKLGQGSFGEIFQGQSKLMQKKIAVKKLKKTHFWDKNQIQTLRVLSSLKHPNIMGYYDYFKTDSQFFIFLELCSKGNLTALLKSKIKQQQVLTLFRQLIEGMCYINSKGKMHRDLKPDNILVDQNDNIKISDFGLSIQFNEDSFISEEKGTPLYAAPQIYTEQMLQYTENCDVWSAGLILYELLTAKRLFQNIKYKQDLKKQWLAYSNGKRVTYSKQYHPFWQYLTNKMLTYDSSKRPYFKDILYLLKNVEIFMEDQLKKKKNDLLENQNIQTKKISMYLIFQIKKYQTLVKVIQELSNLDFNKYIQSIIKFLIMAQYLCHMKRTLGNLRNNTIRIVNEEQSVKHPQSDWQKVYVFDKYRELIQSQYNLFTKKIKNQIQKLQNNKKKNQEQNKLQSPYKSIFQLIQNLKVGLFNVQSVYSKQLKIVVKSQQVTNLMQNIKDLTFVQLKTYYLLLISSQINELFPQKIYAEENIIQNEIQRIYPDHKPQIITKIQDLNKELQK